MAATGVQTSESTISKIAEFQKLGSSLVYIIFCIEDGKIEVEHESDSGDFDAFVSFLPSDDHRYAIYRMGYTTNDGMEFQRICTIGWSPEHSGGKANLLYEGSEKELNRYLKGIALKNGKWLVAATEPSELNAEIVQQALRRLH
jgi:hypothetical protein